MLKFAKLMVILSSLGLVLITSAIPLKKYFTQSFTIKEHLPALTLNTDPSIVAHNGIIRLHDKKDGFFCSAFVVSNEYAITAGHCLDEQIGTRDEILIFDSNFNDTGIKGTTAGVNRRGDTGILMGDFKTFAKVKVGLNPDDQLAYLYDGISHQVSGELGFKSCGYPYGDVLFCSPMVFQGTQIFHIAGQAFLYPGMSGGPLLNSEGIAVGINSYSNETNVGFSSVIGIFKNFGIEIKH